MLMLCYAMLCYAMLCYAMLCCAVLCCAVLCCAVLCYAMLCCAMLWCGVVCRHMSDSQSFPFESKSHPKLWDGAFSPEERYSQLDARELVRNHTITMIPTRGRP
jgi:hypothetical protein